MNPVMGNVYFLWFQKIADAFRRKKASCVISHEFYKTFREIYVAQVVSRYCIPENNSGKIFFRYSKNNIVMQVQVCLGTLGVCLAEAVVCEPSLAMKPPAPLTRIFFVWACHWRACFFTLNMCLLGYQRLCCAPAHAGRQALQSPAAKFAWVTNLKSAITLIGVTPLGVIINFSK